MQWDSSFRTPCLNLVHLQLFFGSCSRNCLFQLPLGSLLANINTQKERKIISATENFFYRGSVDIHYVFSSLQLIGGGKFLVEIREVCPDPDYQ